MKAICDLRRMGFGPWAIVRALNDGDMAVGAEENPTTRAYTPIAWVDGKPIPVSSLIASGFSGTLTNALDVNNDGSILAFGTSAGSTTPNYYLLGAPAPLQLVGRAEEGEDGTHVIGGAAPGLVANVTGVTDEEQFVDQTTTTDGGGGYAFKLAPGNYTLKLENGVCVKGIEGCVQTQKFTITDADKRIDLVAQSGKLAVAVKPKSSTVTLKAGHTVTVKVSVDVSNAGKTASVGPLTPHQHKTVTYKLTVKGPGSFLLEALVIGHTSRGQRLLGVGSAPIIVVK